MTNLKWMSLSLLFFLVSSYSQEKAEKIMSTEYKDKIKNNYKNVKVYDYNPVYQVRYKNYNCPMELYINDVLVVYLAGDGRSAGEQIVQVPQYILKSGVQTVRVKIYPLLDKSKNFQKFVSRDAELKIRITHQDYEREKTNECKEVFKAELPKIEHDLPFIELAKEFTATVPYELRGWSKGVDLNEEKAEELEKEVNERLKEIAGLYRNKDIGGLAKEHYNRVREFDQAYYFTSKENSASWESRNTRSSKSIKGYRSTKW